MTIDSGIVAAVFAAGVTLLSGVGVWIIKTLIAVSVMLARIDERVERLERDRYRWDGENRPERRQRDSR